MPPTRYDLSKMIPFEIKQFAPTRQATVEILTATQRKHVIHGLVEVDVTQPRRLIQKRASHTGEKLSFTGYIVACLAKAVETDLNVHALRDWRNRLILFHEVDVATTIEREQEGQKVVIPLIIRAANQKTVPEIHQEIRAAQAASINQADTFRLMQWYLRLPRLVRRFFFLVLGRSPHLMKKYGGTVMVTAVGMFGDGGGWGIPLIGHPLTITLGGIAQKPALIEGSLETREHLCLTISFDHDLIDGAPATRFSKCFKQLIESGYGLTTS